ncbi:hypothetical protein F0U59_50500 [Archangium gephyra]|nr:hypothetical protein F0U59_50500 [Archangium gephyra]
MSTRMLGPARRLFQWFNWTKRRSKRGREDTAAGEGRFAAEIHPGRDAAAGHPLGWMFQPSRLRHAWARRDAHNPSSWTCA